jgi:hypothetical protein
MEQSLCVDHTCFLEMTYLGKQFMHGGLALQRADYIGQGRAGLMPCVVFHASVAAGPQSRVESFRKLAAFAFLSELCRYRALLACAFGPDQAIGCWLLKVTEGRLEELVVMSKKGVFGGLGCQFDLAHHGQRPPAINLR